MENLCTQLSIDYNTLGDKDGVVPEDYRMDGELLRLMPNLRSVECLFILENYSVFEGMKNLKYLSLDLETFDDSQPAPDISTLRVGHTDRLALENFRQDIAVDLTGSDVDTLLVDSWVAAVTGFKGCENLTSLEFYNTLSDTRIVNAGSFPSLRTLQMNFFSDYARFRDFFQLATFWGGCGDLSHPFLPGRQQQDGGDPGWGAAGPPHSEPQRRDLPPGRARSRPGGKDRRPGRHMAVRRPRG